MADNTNGVKPTENLFSTLRRLFSTDVVIRNNTSGQVVVIDPDGIQQNGVIQTNSLIDRFHKVYTTSTAYGVNLNLAQNYQSARVQIYADYDAMDTDAIISSALDIIADECTLKNEQEQIIQIRSSDERIQDLLENLFYSVLNIEFNLWSWVRNMCIHEDTMIPLLDGRELSIKNLALEMKNNPNKDYWIYSVQEGTNKVVPGKITWCGITRENTELVRVTLDDNTYLDVTPDHKFILRDGSKKQAQDLIAGESLMPFYTNTSDGNMVGYEKIYNPGTGRTNITHRLVAHEMGISNKREENRLKIKCDTHHINFNKKDNSPSNLVRMTKSEHAKLHSSYAINNLWTNEEVIEKRKISIDGWLRSDRRKKMLSDKMTGIYPDCFKNYNESENLHSKHNDVRRASMLKSWASNNIKAMEPLSFREGSLSYISTIINSKDNWVSLTTLINELKDDGYFLDLLKSENPNYRRDFKNIFKINRISKLIEDATNKPYYEYVTDLRGDLKDTAEYRRTKGQREVFLNHKVISVVRLETKANTYCMNVVGPNDEQDRHNFAVCSNNLDGSYTRNGVFVSNCKYGDFYLKLEIAEKFGIYNVIPFSAYNIVRQEGYDPKNPNEVRFKYDPTAALSSLSGFSSAFSNQDGGIWFDNYEMAHFRLVGDVNYLPYGRSYLENARKLFKQYTLIEDAMLIHRITRAPERRIFYVNVGAIPPNEVENYVQKMISKMKKTPLMDPQTGQYNLKYNQQNLLEDFFIPVRGNDSTTRIDTAKGLEYNGIEDVAYFREKLFAALKIPKAFMGYEKDLTGKATLAAEDIRFARTIERIQRIVLSELKKIAIVHLYAHGYTDDSVANFKLSLTNPSIIYDQERMALLKEKLDMAKSAVEDALLPKEYMWEHIFHLSPDTFGELDDMIAEDQKRKFRYKQISEEGNDPAESGKAYGTPHQIATLYGGQGTIDVPTGYNETNPNEPKARPGRPEKYSSIRGTDADPFGRDRLGTYDMKSNAETGEDKRGFAFKGGPMNMENNMNVFLKNKGSLEKMFKRADQPVLLYEESGILDESNIKPDSN